MPCMYTLLMTPINSCLMVVYTILMHFSVIGSCPVCLQTLVVQKPMISNAFQWTSFKALVRLLQAQAQLRLRPRSIDPRRVRKLYDFWVLLLAISSDTQGDFKCWKRFEINRRTLTGNTKVQEPVGDVEYWQFNLCISTSKIRSFFTSTWCFSKTRFMIVWPSCGISHYPHWRLSDAWWSFRLYLLGSQSSL